MQVFNSYGALAAANADNASNKSIHVATANSQYAVSLKKLVDKANQCIDEKNRLLEQKKKLERQKYDFENEIDSQIKPIDDSIYNVGVVVDDIAHNIDETNKKKHKYFDAEDTEIYNELRFLLDVYYDED